MDPLALDVVKRNKGPTILLDGGAHFDFLAPDECDFTIEDVAHGLSMICRFAGHCSRFYSVAEHSVYVSEIVPPALALAGLMHDAAEAFLGDVSKPLKTLLPDYAAIEERVERAVFGKFGLPYPIPDDVKRADRVMLITEQRQIMRSKNPASFPAGIEPASIVLSCYSPKYAKEVFLRRFQELQSLSR